MQDSNEFQIQVLKQLQLNVLIFLIPINHILFKIIFLKTDILSAKYIRVRKEVTHWNNHPGNKHLKMYPEKESDFYFNSPKTQKPISHHQRKAIDLFLLISVDIRRITLTQVQGVC